MNPNSKLRRKWSPKRKLQIVMETLHSDAKLAEICRREGLSPTQVYQWRKTLTASGETLFVPKRRAAGEDPRLQRLQAGNLRMKSVIAEITAENLELKKTLSD